MPKKLKKRFEKYKNFLFDLDGTVWLWSKLIPGSENTIETLKIMKKNIYFVTDNIALSREKFANKLNRFGVPAIREQIINPILVAIDICKGKKAYCENKEIRKELREAGIQIDKKKPDFVIFTEDKDTSIEEIMKVCRMALKGAKTLISSDDEIWIRNKERYPGTGAISRIIEMITGKKSIIIGKESKYFPKTIKKLKLKPKETIFFGDQFNSDIFFANKMKFTSVFVLSGKCKIKDLKKAKGIHKPNIVLNSIKEIFK